MKNMLSKDVLTAMSMTHVPTPGAEDEWLARLIHEIGSNPVCIRIRVTPALQAALLRRNIDANRALRRAWVAKLRRDIERGAFIVNGETIIMCSEGLLLNGQHRCSTEVEFETFVVFGVPRAALLTMDLHAPRTAAEHLRTLQYSNCNELAATSGYVWQWRTNGRIATNSAYKPSKTQVVEYAVAHDAELLDSLSSVGKDSPVPRSILAACHVMFKATAGADAADRFAVAISTDVGHEEGDPPLALRRALANLKSKSQREANRIFEYVVLAWNAWRRGDRIKRFNLKGTLPAVEA